MLLHDSKLARNWHTFADDKQIKKCYNGSVQKWDRTIKAAF